jgi:hypothetical protein
MTADAMIADEAVKPVAQAGHSRIELKARSSALDRRDWIENTPGLE